MFSVFLVVEDRVMSELVLVSARVANGLLAGVYVAFLVAVMPALHGQPDDVYVRVMNRVNVVIVNSAFLAVFLGAPLLCALNLWSYRSGVMVAALGCALIALVVTAVGNIPLNNALAAGGARQAFETPWLIWHAIRTLAALAACVLLCLPISRQG
jgi:uncharacterized membrane protein